MAKKLPFTKEQYLIMLEHRLKSPPQQQANPQNTLQNLLATMKAKRQKPNA